MPDLTTAEMRDLQVELVELLAVQNKPMKRWSPLLDVLDEALARQEREAEAEKRRRWKDAECASCGHDRHTHLERANNGDTRCGWVGSTDHSVHACRCRAFVEPADSPITDGEAG